MWQHRPIIHLGDNVRTVVSLRPVWVTLSKTMQVRRMLLGVEHLPHMPKVLVSIILFPIFTCSYFFYFIVEGTYTCPGTYEGQESVLSFHYM